MSAAAKRSRNCEAVIKESGKVFFQIPSLVARRSSLVRWKTATKNWLRLASMMVAIVSWLEELSSMTLAAITSVVQTGMVFTLLAKCIDFAMVTAIRRPVKLPGPIEM